MPRLSAAVVVSLPLLAATLALPALSANAADPTATTASTVAVQAAATGTAAVSTTSTTGATTSSAATAAATTSAAGAGTSSTAAAPSTSAPATTGAPAPVGTTAATTTTTLAPAPVGTDATACTPHVTMTQVGGSSWWEPITVSIDGSFDNGCTVAPGSTVVLTAALPKGLSLTPASYPFTGGTMTVSAQGVVTFTFDGTFSTTKPLDRVFGGKVLVTFSHDDVAPGQTVQIAWSGAATATTPVTLPTCPDCTQLPGGNYKWAKVQPAPQGQDYNTILSGVSTLPVPSDGMIVTLSDKLLGAQQCVEASLWDVSGRDERGRDISTFVGTYPCADATSVGPVVVPSAQVKAGHAYTLLVTAKTTAYQADGYTDEGQITVGYQTAPVHATAVWQGGSAYGNGNSPAPATSVPGGESPTTAPGTATGTMTPTTGGGTPAPTVSGTVTSKVPAPGESTTGGEVVVGESTTTGSSLPYTGAAIGGLVGLGGLFAAAGAGLLGYSRRRN